jgi:hypothetical protein
MLRSLLYLALTLATAAAASAQIQFTAKMEGAQETPPVTTTATGTGAFVLNAAGTALSYTITVNGLAPTAGHFHNGAVGVPAGVVKPLSFVNNTARGVWSASDPTSPLTDSLLSELLRGRLYVNVHTSANPGGEIRGQVLQSAPAAFSVKMDGLQETPVNTSTASGTGFVVLAPNGTVSYSVTVTGLSPTAAHFHSSPVGVSGGVVKTITLASNSASGTWAGGDATQPLTDKLLRDLVRGGLYMNAHTSAFPGGEIRGQVLPCAGAAFLATINAAQETPPTSSTATGTGWFVLNASGSQLSYNVTLTGITPSAAHFHNGAAGVAAGVVKNLSFTNGAASGVWSNSDATQPFTDSMLVELLRGRLYVNAHTAANPGGEIRGQVQMMGGAGFAVSIDGSQEVPPVSTLATGSSSVVLNPDVTVSYDVTFTGLTPTAAHFHNGPVGVSAPVVKNFSLANNSARGIWTSSDATQPLTDALLRELVKGRLYINAHSSANPGGEIRGQVIGSTGLATAVETNTASSTPTEFQLNQNYPNPFNPTTRISFEIARAARVTLTVYNLLGQTVNTLVDGARQPGNYTVTFGANALPSGMYLYSLAADGVVLQTKKMVLLK